MVLVGVDALARLPLRTSRRGIDRRRLGHEVEVEEFDDLQLDFSGCAARFEQAGDGKEAVHFLKGASALGSGKKGGDEDEEGLRLDDGWVRGVQKVEDKIHVALSAEESARRRVEEEYALENVQS